MANHKRSYKIEVKVNGFFPQIEKLGKWHTFRVSPSYTFAEGEFSTNRHIVKKIKEIAPRAFIKSTCGNKILIIEENYENPFKFGKFARSVFTAHY